MKSLKYRIEYLLVRFAEFLMAAPPIGVALFFGERLGMGMKRVLGKRDALILSNLAASFPEKSPAERRAIADGMWRNIGRVAVEFIRSGDVLTPDRVRITGGNLVKEALEGGNGVVLLSPHYCNWEFTGIMIQKYVHPFVAVYRPMRNPLVDAWVRNKRAVGGVPVILHRQAVRASFKLMRENGVIGLLVDQNLYQGGVLVDFFGRPAATTTLPALLHIRCGAPVIMTHVRRDADGGFHLYLEKLSFPEAPEEERAVVITREINRVTERIIRERPEWWFWIHNRWKRSGEAVAPAVVPS